MKRETPVNRPSACTPAKSHPWRKEKACDCSRHTKSQAVRVRDRKEKQS